MMFNALDGLCDNNGLDTSFRAATEAAAYATNPVAAAIAGDLSTLDSYLYARTQIERIRGFVNYTGGETIVLPGPAGALTLTGAYTAWNSTVFFSGNLRRVCAMITALMSFRSQLNQVIRAAYLGQLPIQSLLYKGADAAQTGGISLVTSNPTAFGNDLERIGRAINFARIDRFGNPSELILNTRAAAGGLPGGVRAAILAAGLPATTLNTLAADTVLSSQDQQRIYRGLTRVTGSELDYLKAALGTTTSGITTAADLLDVRKLFPESYPTLSIDAEPVVTQLGTGRTSRGQSVDSPYGATIPGDVAGTEGITADLEKIAQLEAIPSGANAVDAFVTTPAVAQAAERFSRAMQQISGIYQQSASSLARAAKGILLNTDLPEVTALAVPVPSVANIYAETGTSTNPDNTYSADAALRTAIGTNAQPLFAELTSVISSLDTIGLADKLTELASAIAKLEVTLPEDIEYPNAVSDYNQAVADVEAAIDALELAYPTEVARVQELYDELLQLLQDAAELWAKYEDMTNSALTDIHGSFFSLTTFVKALAGYGLDPQIYALISELADDTFTGQAIISVMREGSNAVLLENNNIPAARPF